MAFAHRLQINGVWVYPPSDYQEMPIPVVGYTLSKRSVRQGYQQMVFVWPILNQEKMSDIWEVWTDALTANETRVEFQYIDKATGELTTKWGTLHEPVVGRRHTVFYDEVAVKFAFISDTQ